MENNEQKHITEQQLKATAAIASMALDIAKTICDFWGESGQGIPDGHLYAMMAGHGISLSSYRNFTRVLSSAGMTISGQCWIPSAEIQKAILENKQKGE